MVHGCKPTTLQEQVQAEGKHKTNDPARTRWPYALQGPYALKGSYSSPCPPKMAQPLQ